MPNPPAARHSPANLIHFPSMTESASQPPAPAHPATDFRGELRLWFGPRTKTSLIFSAAVCFAIFWFLGNFTGVPAERDFQASLLVQPSPLLALLVTAIGLGVCTLLMGVLQGRDAELEDPLFGVAVGLAALSCRGGPMTEVLQNASSPAVFLVLVIELILLYAMFTGCWWLLRKIHRYGPMNTLPDRADWNEKLMAAATTAVVMGVCVLIFAQTDAKKQVLAAVGIAGFVGAAVAYSTFSVRSAWVYAAAPLIVGIVGYLLALVMPGEWLIGHTGQPLAYALPLDYASTGLAGALLGYWTACQWKQEGAAPGPSGRR